MLFGIVNLIGIAGYMYLVFRKLRENYIDDDLVEYGWLSVAMMLIFGRVFYGLANWGVWNDNILDWWMFWKNPGYSVMGGMIGLVVSGVIYALNNQMKFWSWMDDLLIPTYLLTVWLTINQYLTDISNWKLLGNVLPLIVSMLGWWWGNNNYRSVVWYKSGKKGFAVLLANILLGLAFGGYVLATSQSWLGFGAGLFWSLLSVIGLVILSRV